MVKMIHQQKDTIAELKVSMLRLQGVTTASNPLINSKLGIISEAFPNSTFPLGVMHEFLVENKENTSATVGFITGLLSYLSNGGATMWISTTRRIFPPGLKSFGVDPDRFIFLDLKNEKDVLWAMDEALKCGALSTVIGETDEISFTASRRLQLAVENSKITGFILRKNLKKLTTTSCVSRWKITSLPSDSIEDLPGIGFPKWRVELLRVRNGRPGVWDVQWRNGSFVHTHLKTEHESKYRKQAG